jgi:hypothetical protein
MRERSRAVEDDMEFIQSVSRSGGDGAEGDALVRPSYINMKVRLKDKVERFADAGEVQAIYRRAGGFRDFEIGRVLMGR